MKQRDAGIAAIVRCSRSARASPPTPICARLTRAAQFQGWVEADFVFVSPDEIGRVETLSVREGSTSRPARRCSRSMTICSAPPSPRTRPPSPTPSRTYERAQVLLKKAVGSQKAFDDAEVDAAHGRGAAQLGARRGSTAGAC